MTDDPMVKVRAVVPEDAYTAGILGSDRIGNGIVINDNGLILTIGYLITEATDVWLTCADGKETAAHPLAYDHVTGFGLVLPLQKLGAPPLRFGCSDDVPVGATAKVLSYIEFSKPLAVTILARREFAGAWEYLLEGAIFTSPAHPHWSGAALVDDDGALVGLGSLLVRELIGGEEGNANMFVPIDLLKPILSDMLSGKALRSSRPWLGVYAVEIRGRIYVTGVADGSPAQLADLREGDLISRVGSVPVGTLPELYRSLWGLGSAGATVPLTTMRGGTKLSVNVRSVDRTTLLKRPQAN